MPTTATNRNADPPLTADRPEPIELEALEAALSARIESADLPANLRAAVAHALLTGGKRLRPRLTLASAAAVGGASSQALPAAVAIECVHAFSLTHDDLPALDDDDLRRGRPTVHVAFGEAMAILAGDALLALAFQTLGESAASQAAQTKAGRLSRELARATTAMIEGQVFDTLGGLSEALDDRQRLEATHRKKTGALITAACRMGGIAAGADDDADALKRLTLFGDCVGLMFQIVDDLIDVEQTAEHAGKRTGKDARAGKTTYPAVLGVEGSRGEVRRLEREALRAIEPFGERARGLAHLCRSMAQRTR